MKEDRIAPEKGAENTGAFGVPVFRPAISRAAGVSMPV